MQARSPLEQSLQDAIINKNELLAMQLISLIEANGFNLASLDESKKSFFSNALDYGLKDIADKLLTIQLDNQEILFGKDVNLQTPLFFAVKQGYVDIVKLLLKKTRQAKPQDLGYKNWWQANNNGNTLLHFAVLNTNVELIELLLEQLKLEADAKNYINMPNEKGLTPLHFAVNCRNVKAVELLLKQLKLLPDAINYINWSSEMGNTPLHLACDSQPQPCNNHIITLLTENNGNLALKNQNKKTPFELLCQQPDIDKQSNFFMALEMSYYRDCLINQPDNDTLLKQYYKITLMHSLQAYVKAIFEFGDNREIPYNYQFSPKKNKPDEMKMVLPKIYDLVPLYREKAQLALNKEKLKSITLSAVSDEDSEIGLEETISLAAYQLFNQDQDTLNELIKDIENYLAEIQTKPTVFFSSLQLKILITTMLLIVYLAIEIWLGICTYRNNTYLTFSVPFGILGFLGIILSPFASIQHSYHNVSKEDWHDILNKLRGALTLLDQLQYLEEKEQSDRQEKSNNNLNYLPVSNQVIRDLEANLSEFECEKKTLPDMINLIQRLDGILKTIQQGMMKTNKPFSLFYKPPHRILNIPKDNTSSISEYALARENSSLLKH